jgi:energy-coupling factor transporter ATP-binding protein EcfA2
LPPIPARCSWAAEIEVAYFDQFRTQLDAEAPLCDVISPGSDYVEIGGTKKHVIGYLEDFLFAPQRARSPVKSLSGGERNRLLLARLFARPANVLVLDEPTNDLDIETLELLEALLQDYSGTVFLVSHDRAFLDNVVTQTIASEGGGLWKEYVGGYSDWLRQRPAGGAARFDATGGAAAVPTRKVGAGATAPSAARGPQAQFQGAARTRTTARTHRRAGNRAGLAARAAGRSGLLPGARRNPASGPGTAGRRRCRDRRRAAALGSPRSKSLKSGAKKEFSSASHPASTVCSLDPVSLTGRLKWSSSTASAPPPS